MFDATLLKTTQHTSHPLVGATNYNFCCLGHYCSYVQLTQSISWTLRQCLLKQRFNYTLAQARLGTDSSRLN